MSHIFNGFHRGEQYSKWLRTSDLYSVNMTPVLRVWKTLKTQTAIVLALSQLDRMCDVQDKSLETVMPKSRSWSTGVRMVPVDVDYWKCSWEKASWWRGLRLLVRWHIYSNLSSCNAIFFFDDQFVTSSRSDWSALTLFESLMDLHILVSSAKHLRVKCDTQLAMSLMNIKNSMEPKTVPWGRH